MANSFPEGHVPLHKGTASVPLHKGSRTFCVAFHGETFWEQRGPCPSSNEVSEKCNDIAPHGGRAAPLAAGARLIAAPTPRRRHLARRGAALRRRQNGRELAARPRQQKQQRLNFSFSSRLVLSQAHTRATCARVAAFAPRRIRTGSQPARRRRAAAKCTTLTSLRCCCFGTS